MNTNTYRDINFIKGRIMDVGQAMIYNCVDENRRQPLAIKRKIDVDENDELHFSLQTEFEKKHCDGIFPVELFFYRKGKPFFLTVKGVAKNSKGESDVTIRMNEVDYRELPDSTLSGWQKFKKGVLDIQAAF